MNIKLHTPSAGGILIKDSQVLLIYSASRKSYTFPKGTIEDGETKEETAIREVKEETGYTVKIVKFLNEYTYEFNDVAGVRYRKTVSYFLLKCTDDEKPQPNLQAGEDFINVWIPVGRAHSILTFEDAKDALKLATKSTIL